MRRPPRLASRLLAAQVIVVATGVLSLMATSMLAGPGLFHEHLMAATIGGSPGMPMADVRMHAEEAFAASFGFAVTVGATASLAVAVAVAWFLTRRIARPIEALASAADRIATGARAGPTPLAQPDSRRPTDASAQPFAGETGFAAEIDHVAQSFASMGARLEATDLARTRLLADLAHELRTPLATLEAYIDGLEDGVLPLRAESPM